MAVKRTGKLLRHRDRTKRRRLLFVYPLKHTIEPAVARTLVAGGARLHVILGVEMRTGVVRRTYRMDDRQLSVFPECFKRLQARMKAKKSVEVNGSVAFAVGNDNIKAVNRSALENGHQDLFPSVGSCTAQRCRIGKLV